MRKSIRTNMLVIFSLLILITGLIISYISFQTSSSLIKESISDQAEGIAKRAVKTIEVKKYQEITRKSGETDYYHELRDALNNIRETNGLTYLYTMSREKTDKGYEYFYMVDGMPKDSEDSSKLGDQEKEIDDPLRKAFDLGETGIVMSETDEYGAIASAYVPIKDDTGKTIGILGADFDVSKVYSSLDSFGLKMALITGLILLSGIIISYLFTGSLTKPLQELAKKVQLVGKGDLTVLFESNRKDEIGILTESFKQMLQELKGIIREINNNSQTVNQSTSLLLQSANETKAASSEITSTMNQLSVDSALQYNSMDESVHVMEEMSEGMNHIALASLTTSELSVAAVKEVEHGNKRITNVFNQMNSISDSVNQSSLSIRILEEHSNKISAFTEVIKEISLKTNMLALNAAIEAAWAGEAGKGFAVVADEVRTLAEQSKESTDSIQKLVEKINLDTNQTALTMEVVIREVKEGMKAVEDTVAVFNTILSSIEGVNKQVDEVTSTSEQLSAFSEEITSSALETRDIAERSVASTNETAAITTKQEHLIAGMAESIESISKMSHQLQELTNKFKL
ncbi:hypothetical protein CVD28_11430 [Bacillus sp. M6-12]|uniref:methyl-accepting chemotaxis protein n=1 Tax=Bacillus sp. M6-12 TaxID=2054166 RepID=UPI000C75B154|nr:methyl-accepting chemotaxis protein [Bacillus sp. M6-12]PLS17598.1 hypothetical protein CVD28_11430 [Bacillus sp. M6-12]